MTEIMRSGFLRIGIVALAALVAACGGSSPSSAPSSGPSCSSAAQSPVCASAASDPAPNGTFTPLTGDNVMGITVGFPNLPMVSVTICTHGTSNCQTINNVLLDTGSFGLRLFASAISGVTPTQYTVGSQSIAECTEFGSANTWGPVNLVDLQIDGQTLSNFPYQQIDSTFAGGPPASSACEQMGSIASPAVAGWNGILGIGLLVNDCPDCVFRIPTTQGYYACTGNVCTGTTLAAANQVHNPVANLSTDNNGILLELPQVGSSGSGSVSGYLAFGIGTTANNSPANWGVSKVYFADGNLMMRTIYNSQSYDSFLDSGSNTLSPPDCFTADNSGFLAPSCSVNLSATNESATTRTSSQVFFQIANVNSLSGNAFNNLGSETFDYPGLGPVFDWGLPFFFGRTVFVGLAGKSAASLGGATGPYWAY